ncbi:MAG: hypothetical protein EPO13_12255 [Actinomycetota bacterium]|nr:MAG: hypothetical protein EPO13_12255 [Actinomycetota bacterium]
MAAGTANDRRVVVAGPVDGVVQVEWPLGLREQFGTCGGRAQPSPTVDRLVAPVAVHSVVMCGTRDVTLNPADSPQIAEAVTELVAGLAQPDETKWMLTTVNCASFGVMVPPFALITPQGITLRPVLPLGPCKRPGDRAFLALHSLWQLAGLPRT